MTAPTLTVTGIQTKPERDPYANLEGVVSMTYLKLDPRDSTLWVCQEYNDNAQPMEEWHNLILTWRVDGHPREADMAAWIDSHMAELLRICAGYEAVWNGNNTVGKLDDDARAADDALRMLLERDGDPAPYYEFWTLEAWTNPGMAGDILPATSDEELRRMANEAIAALGGHQVLDGDADDVFRYFQEYRDALDPDD